MQYVSTRGKAPPLGFGDVLLTGLATDGGLYLPVEWPNLTVDDLVASLGPDPSYQEVALEILYPFASEMLSREELNGLIQDAYATFSHPDIAPLKEIGDNIWILELFHTKSMMNRKQKIPLPQIQSLLLVNTIGFINNVYKHTRCSAYARKSGL